jgi:tetratricopeptide (TPR) repeat protein
MDLEDGIRSYETAFGRLPAQRDRRPKRLLEALKQAFLILRTTFGTATATPQVEKLSARLSKGLREALAHLKPAFAIPSASPAGGTQEDELLALLLTRDEIHRLVKDGPLPAPESITRLATADQQLKRWAAKQEWTKNQNGNRTTMASTLASWRESAHPASSEWWWSLDEFAKPHALWTLLAGLFFAGSIALGAATFTILKNVTTSNVTLFGTIAQSVLALLAGSAFTSAGREWLSTAFSAVGIDRRFRGASRMWLAFVVFGLILAGWFFLPVIASRHYFQKGGEYQKSGLLHRSIESYQQAITLKPDYVEARFGLAASLAEAHEYDKAIEEYKRIGERYPDQSNMVNQAYLSLAVSLDRSREYDKAIELYKRLMDLDPNDFMAVNNLARLYILRRQDASGALALLDRLRARLPELSKDARYHYHKNRGWANLELRFFDAAEGELRAALKVRDGASAHFLLGRVLESQNRIEDARNEWRSFNRRDRQNLDQENEIESDWSAHATQKLFKPVGQPEKGGQK